ncbi:hypothetical protein F5X97DRAFT_224201 [Nemania serpens]|nr:hypothetical protein F5X97DRAFT_224201 [Nemania serpens]
MSEPQVASPTSPLTSFPKFPELPTELRLMIWAMSMSMDTRNLYLFRHPPGHARRVLTRDPDGGRFIEVPAFFFVNHECRHVALNTYKVMPIDVFLITNLRLTKTMLEVNLFVRDDDTLFFESDNDNDVYINRVTHGHLHINPRKTIRVVSNIYLGGNYTKVLESVKYLTSPSRWKEITRLYTREMPCRYVSVSLGPQNYIYSTRCHFEVKLDEEGRTVEPGQTSAKIKVAFIDRTPTAT